MNNVTGELKREGLSLMQQTWFWVPNWKWLGLAVALIAGVGLFYLLRWAFDGARTRLLQRIPRDEYRLFLLREPLQGPLALVLVAFFGMSALRFLALPEGGDRLLTILLQFTMGWGAIRLAYMAVDAGGQRFAAHAKTTPSPLDDQLAPFLSRTAKILVVVLGALMVLQNVGVNVVSVLAGLGLGGLAIALAAQDTFANLFGSITILLDRPFQVGDLIKVGDTEGTVEEIGLRSTRVRTATRSLITVPNLIMAKERVENLGARHSRRVRHVIGLNYDTSPQKLHEFMDHVRYVLLQHPLVLKEDVLVYFQSLGESSLNVLVNFYVGTRDGNEELRVQQDILFQIMQIAAHDKVDFAFPTRTLLMANPAAPAPRLPPAPPAQV